MKIRQTNEKWAEEFSEAAINKANATLRLFYRRKKMPAEIAARKMAGAILQIGHWMVTEVAGEQFSGSTLQERRDEIVENLASYMGTIAFDDGRNISLANSVVDEVSLALGETLVKPNECHAKLH